MQAIETNPEIVHFFLERSENLQHENVSNKTCIHFFIIGHWFVIMPRIFKLTSAILKEMLSLFVLNAIDYLSTCCGGGIIKHSTGLTRSHAGMAKHKKAGWQRRCQTSHMLSAPRRCKLELTVLANTPAENVHAASQAIRWTSQDMSLGRAHTHTHLKKKSSSCSVYQFLGSVTHTCTDNL